MNATINTKNLVSQSVIGEIHSPTAASAFRVGHEGEPRVLPATGGITYNVKVGDSVFGMAGDHIEPGVSLRNKEVNENSSLNLLACIGNQARVVSGDAKDAVGYVTGKHGGIEHVLIYFDDETLEKLAIGDKIQIKSAGQGMRITGFEDTICAMNLDPVLFEKLGVTVQNGVVHLPVAGIVPAHLMGSGIGSANAYRGDYDIMTADKAELEANNLQNLRYGDILMLQDCDTTFGRGYLKGAVTIGVVVHSDCILMGHGPGVTTLFTAKTPILCGDVSERANIAEYLGLCPNPQTF